MGEIVFFDVETTVPTGTGQRFWVLEFGAILVCPRRLVEVDSYCTLIRPDDLSAVSEKRFSGITRNAVASAPRFEEVADKIFGMLNGRVWAGHNIQRFDCHRIKEAFADISRPGPEPIGLIDSLAVLGHGFGRRAGDLKMATLASYFGLGRQKHRSLDDVRMNLEVIKHCATVLLLESSLPHILHNNKNQGNLNVVTRSKVASGESSCAEELASRKSPAPMAIGSTSTSTSQRVVPYNYKSPPTNFATSQRVVPYKSPPTSQRVVPYQLRDRLGKVLVETAKEALQGAQRTRPLNSLLRHSRSLLR